MEVRIDKYLWCVRLSKTRSQATELVKKGKIKLNGDNAKPSKEISTGDTISVDKNTATFTYTVKALLDKRVGAKLVDDYITDITPEAEVEKYKSYRAAQESYRMHGTGKPSKKERRAIESFLKWKEE
ncbi:MAG: S4 domain-containing protein [Brumimicrobium sp.]|nr:S4 domain-containing protein [Brumimicrobium sp.]